MRIGAGQLLYASEKLRAERGLGRKGKEALGDGRLLVGCAEISAAFWDTPWGCAMRDELDNKPFRPCDLFLCHMGLESRLQLPCTL